MEVALNQTAERLGGNLPSLRMRHELATMLDSMQEAVVAITPEGLVRWSNSVMKRIAGTQIRPGSPLVHSVRDPELLLAFAAPWSATKYALARQRARARTGLRDQLRRCPAAARSRSARRTGIEAAQQSRPSSLPM